MRRAMHTIFHQFFFVIHNTSLSSLFTFHWVSMQVHSNRTLFVLFVSIRAHRIYEPKKEEKCENEMEKSLKSRRENRKPGQFALCYQLFRSFAACFVHCLNLYVHSIGAAADDADDDQSIIKAPAAVYDFISLFSFISLKYSSHQCKLCAL